MILLSLGGRLVVPETYTRQLQGQAGRDMEYGALQLMRTKMSL